MIRNADNAHCFPIHPRGRMGRGIVNSARMHAPAPRLTIFLFFLSFFRPPLSRHGRRSRFRYSAVRRDESRKHLAFPVISRLSRFRAIPLGAFTRSLSFRSCVYARFPAATVAAAALKPRVVRESLESSVKRYNRRTGRRRRGVICASTACSGQIDRLALPVEPVSLAAL